MKIHKTVTDKVMAANRINSQKSTGPKNTSTTRKNATKHALTSQYLSFRNQEEESEFLALRTDLANDFKGTMGQLLEERIAWCCLRLRRATTWEMEELARRHKASRAIVEALSDSNGEGDLSSLQENKATARLGWDCPELEIQSANGSSKDQLSFAESKNVTTSRARISAKLTSALDTALRYSAHTQKELYQAIAAHREVQRDDPTTQTQPEGEVE